MWDNFLGAPPANEEGGGGNVRLHMSLQIGAPKKKEKQQLTRWVGEAARGRSEHLRGYDSLEGKCCLPTCLRGRQLYRTHTAAHTHERQRINRPTTAAQEGRFNTCNTAAAGRTFGDVREFLWGVRPTVTMNRDEFDTQNMTCSTIQKV